MRAAIVTAMILGIAGCTDTDRPPKSVAPPFSREQTDSLLFRNLRKGLVSEDEYLDISLIRVGPTIDLRVGTLGFGTEGKVRRVADKAYQTLNIWRHAISSDSTNLVTISVDNGGAGYVGSLASIHVKDDTVDLQISSTQVTVRIDSAEVSFESEMRNHSNTELDERHEFARSFQSGLQADGQRIQIDVEGTYGEILLIRDCGMELATMEAFMAVIDKSRLRSIGFLRVRFDGCANGQKTYGLQN